METPTETRNFSGPNVVLGLGILALGLALLLDRLHVIDAWAVLQFWPILVVVFGASIVWQSLRGGAADGQKHTRMIISPGLILLLVFVGLLANHANLSRPNRTLTSGDDRMDVHAVLGDSRLTSTTTHFRGANMTSVMGSTVLDLRQATLAEGEPAVIEVFGLMGSLDVLVPRDWVVESDVVPMLGDETDHRWSDDTEPRRGWRGRWNRRQPDSPTANAVPPAPPVPASELPGTATSASPPHLIIRGSVMMGSLDIRS
jgi:hypothetical protein